MSENQQKLEINASRQFVPWLAQHNLSIALTTYQAGKIFLIGLQNNGELSVFERTLDRCMGLWVQGKSLYTSTLYQLWRFENILDVGEGYEGYDALYVPQMSYVTGDLDIHDLTLSEGQIIFVNTLFSCLATVSPTHSFIVTVQGVS
jgi:uncharacterized protein (TIGR03032 family)